MKIGDWSRCATVQFIVFCLWSGLGLVQVPQRVEGRGEAENTENKGELPWQRGSGKGLPVWRGWASSPKLAHQPQLLAEAEWGPNKVQNHGV